MRWRPPRAVAAVAHLVLAFAVLTGILHSGGRYFYCEAFGLQASDPCAEVPAGAHDKGATAERDTGTLGERQVDCCAIVNLEAMPQAAQASGPSVAPAARVAIVPALGLAGALAGPLDAAAPSRVERSFAGWRPPPRTPGGARAQLMVFQI